MLSSGSDSSVSSWGRICETSLETCASRQGFARSLRAPHIFLFLALGSSLPCLSADLVLIRSSANATPEQKQLELAAQFYGLSLKTIAADHANTRSILEAARQDTTVGVAIEATALAGIDERSIMQAMGQRPAGRVPLLLLGMTPETDRPLVNKWSNGSVIGVGSLSDSSPIQYVVGRIPDMAHQLAGVEFPGAGGNAFYFDLDDHHAAKVIMAVRSVRQNQPVFIEENLGSQPVFLLCRTQFNPDQAVDYLFDSKQNAFGEIAAVMMFVKQSAGERGWHALRHYANLTIDDPWLREPYGMLNYQGLLTEMEKHRFHTTIAFIPWNFDRSQPEVVSIFRRNPDKFSICIHGDNHDHKEFTDYRQKPLNEQVSAMRQSVARMEKFQALTGISYDRVMVFPHSVAPEKTFEALKANNYLATVNSQNVPMDSARPAGSLFALRPTTLLFGGFPSALRVEVAPGSANYPVAINAFLDNPLLYYSHQDLFADGINAFDATADEVNRIEPDTNWNGLGEIVRHLYVVRLRDDTNYDVLAFSSNLLIENTSGHDAIFFVHREDSKPGTIAAVNVDGQSVPFKVDAGNIGIQVPVSAGQTRSVVIQYQEAPGLLSTPIAKNSVRVSVLRRVSDFRDITLSRIPFGQTLTSAYYGYGSNRKLVVLCGCGLLVVCLAGCWWLILIKRKRAARTISGRSANTTARKFRSGKDWNSRGFDQTGHSTRDAASESDIVKPSLP